MREGVNVGTVSPFSTPFSFDSNLIFTFFANTIKRPDDGRSHAVCYRN